MSSDLEAMTLGALQLEWKQSIAAYGRRPVSWADLDSILAVILEEQIVLHKRITQQAAEITALKQRPQLRYAGTWRPDERYPEAAFVTHAGGLWLSIEETRAAPGSTGSGWLLVVKRGEAR